MKEQRYVQKLENYIKQNVKSILKTPRSFIRHPFIDPGSVYDGNVWDWDTYWSVYGLLEIMDLFDEQMKQQIVAHAQGNVLNFFDHQLEDGYIPMMIEVLDWPEPYLNTKHKEGVMMNMHKPFLCGQICLISEYLDSYEWVAGFVEALEKYFACYDKYYYHENSKLYIWQDDIMIGMDNDPATFGRPPRATANIFLNSFMVLELQHMQQILNQFGMEERSKYYEQKEKDLQQAIQDECWDSRDAFFYSVDVDIKTRVFDWFHEGLGVFWKTLPIKIRVWSGFIPAFAKFATPEQVMHLAEHYRDENTFHSAYGVATLAKDEKMFNLEVTNNPSNWLGPIWLVANYVVFKGLLNYGYREEAKELCHNTLKLLGEDLEKTGSLHEYYNPFTGEPIMNGGFLNWNILALTMVKELRENEI